MKDILTVMKFTIKDMVKRKSFIISTLIILLMIVIGMNIPNIMKAVQGEDVAEKLLIVDSQDIFEGELENLKQIGDLLDDYHDEAKEEKRGILDLFTKLTEELMNEGFLADLMASMEEAAEKEMPKMPQDHKKPQKK